jgi:transcriptional regulator with XRE-family HTH domain
VPGIDHFESVRREIVRRLRAERLRKKLSNYAVSQNSGVSESMLSLVEHGLRNPTMELLLRIADGIGVNLADVVNDAQAAVPKKAVKQKK